MKHSSVVELLERAQRGELIDVPTSQESGPSHYGGAGNKRERHEQDASQNKKVKKAATSAGHGSGKKKPYIPPEEVYLSESSAGYDDDHDRVDNDEFTIKAVRHTHQPGLPLLSSCPHLVVSILVLAGQGREARAH